MQLRPALPIGLHVAGRRVVIVGDGPTVEERSARLGAAGAQVLRLGSAALEPRHLEGAVLILCLDATRGVEVSSAARERGVLVYVQDRPELSDLSMPALARRGPLTLAVSTQGVAPALAGRLREQLEALLATAGADLDRLIEDMSRLRASGEHNQLSGLARRLRIAGRIEIDP